MLCLSRKRGEKIVLTGGIEVTVVAIKGNVVRLGFVAPQDVKILRSELEGQEKSRNQQRLPEPEQTRSSTQSDPPPPIV